MALASATTRCRQPPFGGLPDAGKGNAVALATGGDAALAGALAWVDAAEVWATLVWPGKLFLLQPSSSEAANARLRRIKALRVTKEKRRQETLAPLGVTSRRCCAGG